MFKTLFLLSALLICKPLAAEEKPLRFRELIPESWIEFPAVDPAIPSHYISAIFDETGHLLWGTKEDIEVFTGGFESPIQSELIALHHSYNVFQTGPASFSCEANFAEELNKLGVEMVKTKKQMWGNYPVFSVSGMTREGKPIRMAWVGLNTANRTTLFMALYLPKNADQNCPVWNELLAHTVQLEEPEFFRAMGMDMQEGFTIYHSGSASLKVTAEKRVGDNLLAIMIEPLSANTSYKLEEVSQGIMGTQWKNHEPCAKIYGVMIEKEGKYGTCVDNSVITVLIRDVADFSFNLDPGSHAKEVVIFKKPSTL